jgi:ATP-dependent exoDNAse (exonuclease V) beta subunit
VVAAALSGDPAADELWRERPFVTRVGDELIRGQFDRVVVRRQNGKAAAAQLVDFKTDTATATTLAGRVEAYRPQMASYRAALAAMLGLDPAGVKVKLLFVGAGEVVEV